MEGEIITKEKQPDIYKWLSENIESYENKMEYFTLTSEGKINAYCSVYLRKYTKQIKYPFGVVKDNFVCAFCKNLNSLVNSPKEVGGYFSFSSCENITSLVGLPKYIGGEIFFYYNRFSNVPIYKERYKLYLAMWFELLESVSKDYVKFYLINYECKADGITTSPIIPKEIINKYKIDILLNKK